MKKSIMLIRCDIRKPLKQNGALRIQLNTVWQIISLIAVLLFWIEIATLLHTRIIAALCKQT